MRKLFSLSVILAAILAAASVVGAEKTIVPLLSEGQKNYVNMPREKRIAYFADKKCRREMRKLGYYPLTFSIGTTGVKKVVLAEADNAEAKSKTATVGSVEITVPAYVLAEAKNGAISFGNLKIAKEYRWKCDNGKTGTFATEDVAPRLLKLNGVPNVRDLGGRLTSSGKRVRQGMIYRTAGLNDNASVRREPFPQSKMDADNGFLAKRKARLKDRVARNQALLKGEVKEIELVPYSLRRDWTVYVPEPALKTVDLRVLASLKSLPATLWGGKAAAMTADAKGKMGFPEAQLERLAVFGQVFDSPADGFMQIGTGADWFYAVVVNGEVYWDLLSSGDGKKRTSIRNHVINIPVKKGKNIIVIPVRSGSAGWALAVGQPSKPVAYKTVLKKEIQNAQKQLDTCFGVEVFGKGRNRLDDAARSYFVNDLGVKSDIDLRSDRECRGMTGSPAGKEVRWFHYSSSAYGGMQNSSGKKAFTKVFKVFLDEKNYPIVFHCIAGQDRTGAVAFILNALLGVPEEQLFLDWEVTGFWNGSPSFNHENLFNNLYAGFDRFPGKTINERVENYVLSLGFSKGDIEKLRGIMLEK